MISVRDRHACPSPFELRYSVTVQSVLPLLSTATIECVALPPDVVAGTVTKTYVPPLNGARSPMRPAIAFVHAVAPDAVEIAVSVLAMVPSVDGHDHARRGRAPR